MLLILTNSQDTTADYLVSVLEKQGVESLRFDTDKSISTLEFFCNKDGPRLCFENQWYSPRHFKNIWYRRPERLKHNDFADSPESRFVLDEWSEALEGFFALIPRSLWMNHPSCNVAASHKIEQLTLAKSLGLLVPDTLVTHDAVCLRKFFSQHDGMVVAKPMGRGYVERSGNEADSLVYTNRLVPADLDSLQDLKSCPTLFQQYVDKTFDVRITVIDDDLHAVELRAEDEDGKQRCDVRRNNMEDVAYRRTTLPAELVQKIKTMMQHYHLRFSAVDMVVGRDGRWYFLEINPNGQWAWLDIDGGTDIASSFVRVFSEQ